MTKGKVLLKMKEGGKAVQLVDELLEMVKIA